MSSKIQGLKTALVEQTELIKTLREEKKTTREGLTNLYTVLVRYKVAFTAGSTAIEDLQYPDIRAEDVHKISVAEQIGRIGTIFQTVTNALHANRDEVSAMLKELDVELDDAMAQWQNVQAQEARDGRAEAFRTNTAVNGQKTRPTTPDVLAPLASSSRDNVVIPPVVNAPNGKTAKGRADSPTTKKASSPTTKTNTLAGVLGKDKAK